MDKSEEDDRPVKKYVKNQKYNEFGADEVGKESYGPFVVCAVYYDDEFNQDIFDMQLTDSKAKRIKPKIKEIAEELMNPKNKLKYVVVAMTDLDSMKDLMPNGVDATYNYNEIRKRVGNTNNVQAILMNEAIRILVERYLNVDISESTYDRFVGKDIYYKYLEGKQEKTTSKVHVSNIIDGTKIVYDVVPTEKADKIMNSPSAAASIIASYVRLNFFEKLNNELKVVDPNNGEIIEMPSDNDKEKVIRYGELFIKKYGIEKFNEVTKKNKAKNPFDDMEALKSEKAKKKKSEPYYNKII